MTNLRWHIMMALSNGNIFRVTGPLGIHRSPVKPQHKSQWRGALMFSLICAGINQAHYEYIHYNIDKCIVFHCMVIIHGVDILWNSRTTRDNWWVLCYQIHMNIVLHGFSRLAVHDYDRFLLIGNAWVVFTCTFKTKIQLWYCAVENKFHSAFHILPLVL